MPGIDTLKEARPSWRRKISKWHRNNVRRSRNASAQYPCINIVGCSVTGKDWIHILSSREISFLHLILRYNLIIGIMSKRLLHHYLLPLHSVALIIWIILYITILMYIYTYSMDHTAMCQCYFVLLRIIMLQDLLVDSTLRYIPYHTALL